MNHPQNRKISHKKIVIVAACIALGMYGVAFAFVPLYRMFCQITGYAGTPAISASPSETVLDRTITVSFDSNVDQDLPWDFKPMQRSQKVKVGENSLAFFYATNNSDKPIKGMATFTVTPNKSAPYFSKVQCFCFNEQIINPGEKIEFPVSYYIDPKIAEDKNLDDIKTITLSYTFFRVKDGA